MSDNANGQHKPVPWAALTLFTAGIAFSRYVVLPRYGFGGFVVGFLVSGIAARVLRGVEERHWRDSRPK